MKPQKLPPLEGRRPERTASETVVQRSVDWDGQPTARVVRRERLRTRPDGSLEREVTVSPWTFFHCGHPQSPSHPVGGQCGVPGCARVSCAACFAVCALDGCPLCREHQVFVLDEGGVRQRLCPRCAPEVQRRLRRRRVLRAVLGWPVPEASVPLPFAEAPSPPRLREGEDAARPARRAGSAGSDSVGSRPQRVQRPG